MGIVDRKITCTNGDGISLEFGERGMTPFVLGEAEGCYLADNRVTISDNTMTDGGAYQGSVAKVRNIVLTLIDYDDHVANRNLLNALFKSGQIGTLVFHEDTNDRQIKYYVESVDSTGIAGARTYSVSLLCPDPFFYAMSDIRVMLANWVSAFEFPHEFTSEGEVFGYRSSKTIENIVNEQAEDGTGLTFTIKANAAVRNPKITKVETNESIEVGSSATPFNMVVGDVLTITTSNNDKHVYLTHNGITTEVNQYLTENSVFIQLMRGDNTIGYQADSGADAMEVTIQYRLKYASA